MLTVVIQRNLRDKCISNPNSTVPSSLYRIILLKMIPDSPAWKSTVIE